jgi:hypothetical protein
MEFSRLSEKWLSVTDDLLSSGPIFSRSLEGPLGAYEIKITAGLCDFRVGGNTTFSAVLLAAAPENQNQRLLDAFCKQLESVLYPTGACADLPAFLSELKAIHERPAFVVVNWFHKNVSEQDQGAMFQLAYHFAGSYFRWRRDAFQDQIRHGGACLSTLPAL